MRPLLFATPTEEVFELTQEELGSRRVESATAMTLPSHSVPNTLYDSAEPATTPPAQTLSTQSLYRMSCGSASPLIEILTPDELAHRNSPSSPQTPPSPVEAVRRDGNKPRSFIQMAMAYDEYGELVAESKLRQHQTPDELSITQLLRLVRKKFHHELRAKITDVVYPLGDGKAPLVGNRILTQRLTSWILRPSSPMSSESTPDEVHGVRVKRGPPQVLEIGCSDGSWCHDFKNEEPTWIVQGVDDTDHWACVDKDLVVRDFMTPGGVIISDDYFNQGHPAQQGPEFTVRNLNCLLAHQNPMQLNLYTFIRAREIFDRVESYKTFLEDIRLMLKPRGIVEFIEIDPRPRLYTDECGPKEVKKAMKKSRPVTDWTDNIQDRFKDPHDAELATDVPGWSKRVEERLKANLRWRDGVAAANLKSWLEGAGSTRFYDVQQRVRRIPVGGDTVQGQLLKKFLCYQLELEDDIPKLRKELPEVDMDQLESGSYALNLHIVTGCKPSYPRPGDLLSNGTREEMTDSTYSVMARNDAQITFKRFDLEGKLSSMMKNLTTLEGAPGSHSATGGSVEDGLFPLLARKSDREIPFNAPPFVTVQELEPQE